MLPTAARTAARLTIRYGVEVELCKSRSDLLADGAGAWAYAIATQHGCQRLLYDNIGVGAGAAASLRNKSDIKVQGWNAAGAVVNRSHRYEGTRPNEDMFANAKAQSWWPLRDRFLETFKATRRGLRSRCHHQPEPGDRGAARAEERAEPGHLPVQRGGQGPGQQSARRPRKPEPGRSVMIAFAPVSSGVQILGVWDADGFTELWG